MPDLLISLPLDDASNLRAGWGWQIQHNAGLRDRYVDKVSSAAALHEGITACAEFAAALTRRLAELVAAAALTPDDEGLPGGGS
jgi:hypothetical protein